MEEKTSESVYDPRFTEPRNQWLATYFSWSDNNSEEEIHTAKDGFDAGANFQLKKDQKIIEELKGTIANLLDRISASELI